MKGGKRSEIYVPSAISTVSHCRAPMTWRIVVNSRSKEIIEPGFDLAINSCREDKLQFDVIEMKSAVSHVGLPEKN